MSKTKDLNEYKKSFFKELYYKEIERKRHLNKHFRLPMGIIIALIGILSFFVNQLPLNIEVYGSSGTSLIPITLFVSTVLLGVCILMAIIRIIQGYHGGINDDFRYGYLSDPKELENYIDDKYDYYEHVMLDKPLVTEDHSNDPSRKTIADFEEQLTKRYVNYASHNGENNDDKAGLLHRTNEWIMLALFAILIGAIPFFMLQTGTINFGNNHQPEEVKKVDPTQPTLQRKRVFGSIRKQQRN